MGVIISTIVILGFWALAVIGAFALNPIFGFVVIGILIMGALFS